MDKLKKLYHRVTGWLGRHAVGITVLLSVLHIGVAHLHVRDSGRADVR